jgi:hypothetical protein
MKGIDIKTPIEEIEAINFYKYIIPDSQNPPLV